MRIKMSASRAALLFDGMEKRLVRALIAAEALTVEDAKKEAIKASSGPLSTAELRRRDHPYARRHGVAREDPSIINEQTGQFKKAWKSKRPVRRGARIVSSVRNADPKAKFMHGTRYMLPRPIIARIAKAIRPYRRIRIRRALWGAVTTY